MRILLLVLARLSWLLLVATSTAMAPCNPTPPDPLRDRTLTVQLELADGSGHLAVAATPPYGVRVDHDAGPESRFLLIDLDGGSLRPGDEILLLGAGERYIGVDVAGLAIRGDRTVGYDMGSDCASVLVIDAAEGSPATIEAGARVRLRSYLDPCRSAVFRGPTAYLRAAAGTTPAASTSAGPDTVLTFRVLDAVEPPRIEGLSAPFANPDLFTVTNFMDLERHSKPRPPLTDPTTLTASWLNAGTYDDHTGIDFSPPWPAFRTMDEGGLPVLAVADGEVIYVVQDRDDRCHQDKVAETSVCPDPSGAVKTENEVLIRHAGDFVSVYAHLQRNSVPVAVGDRVRCGQLIGRVGSSGGSGGPHLHFELKVAHDPAWFSKHPGAVFYDGLPGWNFWRRSRPVDPFVIGAWASMFQADDPRDRIPRVTCVDDGNRVLALRAETAVARAVARRGARYDSCGPASGCGIGLHCERVQSRCEPLRRPGEACDYGGQCIGPLGCVGGTCALGPDCVDQCPAQCDEVLGVGCMTRDLVPQPCGLLCLPPP